MSFPSSSSSLAAFASVLQSPASQSCFLRGCRQRAVGDVCCSRRRRRCHLSSTDSDKTRLHAAAAATAACDTTARLTDGRGAASNGRQGSGGRSARPSGRLMMRRRRHEDIPLSAPSLIYRALTGGGDRGRGGRPGGRRLTALACPE